MEFNLSQFDSAEDLIGAFHQVRDRVLQGFIPVVFRDEFDSQNLKWLRSLLACSAVATADSTSERYSALKEAAAAASPTIRRPRRRGASIRG